MAKAESGSSNVDTLFIASAVGDWFVEQTATNEFPWRIFLRAGVDGTRTEKVQSELRVAIVRDVGESYDGP